MSLHTRDNAPKTAVEQPERIGFFDLPREIRDVIYAYSIISMRDDRWEGHKRTDWDYGSDWSAQCFCQQDALCVIRPRPPYFAHHAQSCLVPDRFLYSVSLVSKQFATEIRPLFWQLTALQLETDENNREVLRGNFGGPLMKDFSEFIEALGTEAKDLRRMVITKRIPYDEYEMRGDFSDEEAEEVLEPYRNILPYHVEVMVVMRRNRGPYEQIFSFFQCERADGGKNSFTAKEIMGPDEWEYSNAWSSVVAR